MEDTKHLVVKGNLLQAHTWKGLLETYGIEVELRGESLVGGVGELPVDVQSVELWVTSAQLEVAKVQLSKLDIQQPSWLCLQCKEENEASFELCWRCGAERSQVDN